LKAPSLLLIDRRLQPRLARAGVAGQFAGAVSDHAANYCLRAIPLGAGHHLLRVEYSPLGFRIGKAVSIVAWPVFIGFAGLVITNRERGGRKRLHLV